MKHIITVFLAVAASISAFAVDLNVSSGQLESLISGGSLNAESSLKLTGTIDARDLAAMEKLPSSMKSLDLSGVKINALSMPNRRYFGRTLFANGEIPAYTFFKTGLETLTLPADASIICEGAFAGSSLTSIVIPEGVTELGDYAFYGCGDLVSVTLPSSLQKIGKGVFGNCQKLESINLSATTVKEIPERAFSGSVSLKSLSLPAGILKIGREAFSNTAVTSLSLQGVNEFEAYALSGMTRLESLAINPDAIIGDGLLMDNISLASLSGMPEFVPDYFAANCQQFDTQSVNQASSLGKYSFANTLAPEELFLPAFIEKIERGAFSGLSNIKKIDVTALEDRVPEVDEFTFEGIDQPEIVLWVDDAAFDLWEGDPVWRLFKVMSVNQTGIEKVDQELAESIAIKVKGGVLTVDSSSPVTDLRVFTSDGKVAYVASPGREHVEVETAALPQGVVVVVAKDQLGSSKTVSFMLK